ncbi:MAG: YfbR-like 5'-deoxynucleotidase, partial [Christensenellales bacterium]
YNKIEEVAIQRLLSMLPQDLVKHYKPLIAADTDTPEWRIVKAADRICAYVKCLEEKVAGNREFAEAERGILSSIHTIELPEVKDFMDEFVPGFAMTLDQISK